MLHPFYKIILSFLFLQLFHCNDMQAQDKIKFGKIEQEELAMTKFEKDTAAEAIVLYDKGVLDGNSLQFTRHMRVKILKKTGYERANLLVDVPGKSNVRGFSYNLEGGEIVKTKLSNESIFQEDVVDGLSVLRVFMPNVKEGTIIEVEYSHFGPPFEWKFQDEIPVLYSELYLQPNTYIDFSKNMYGYHELAYTGSDRWVAKNMPALRKEPFTNSINNYINKMEIEVRSINIPGSYYREFSSSWEKVLESLASSENFGKIFSRSGFMKQEAKAIMDTCSTVERRIAAAHAYIKENIKWNGDERLYASSNISSILKKEQIGNSADINLSLICLIHQMDINVLPVVLSTVDNGVLHYAQASLSKLNYVAGYVKLGDIEYFLDATEPNLPAGLLPERCLNGQGRLIGSNVNRWIDLTPKDKIDKIAIMADYVMEQDGTIKGNINCKRYDYAALHFRDEVKNMKNEEACVKDLETKFHGMLIEDYTIKNKDQNLAEPVYEELRVDLTEMADDLGNTIAFTPLFFNIEQDNPYKAASRVYPIHLPEPKNKLCMVSFTIPQGYAFIDLPESVNIKLPDNAGTFLYQVTKVAENKVQIVYRFQLNKTVFLPDDYPNLQHFHTIIMDNVSKQLLIRNRT